LFFPNQKKVIKGNSIHYVFYIWYVIEQKHTKKKVIKTKDYTNPGKPLTELEFIAMVNESEESGYLPLDELKKMPDANQFEIRVSNFAFKNLTLIHNYISEIEQPPITANQVLRAIEKTIIELIPVHPHSYPECPSRRTVNRNI